ncbi:hypothetical protein M9Y10_043579 [Tritrichomonas musculus]|uniref:Uncharacterized protein n=1 Tax=Tritrichomonas musculus TaxID=1915356 RepID=A0ABR2K048_9EUKA
MNIIEASDIPATIESLRKERQIAISQCNYIKAQQLDSQINKLRAKLKDLNKQAAVSNGISNFEREKQYLRESATRLQSEYTKFLYNTRAKYQRRYSFLLNKQREEVKKLASEFAKNIELESIRRVPESEVLLRESQLRANVSQFAIANQLNSEAEMIKSNTLQQRQTDVRQQFQMQQDLLLHRQQEETDTHLKKLKKELHLVNLEYQTELSKLKKSLIAHGIKYGVNVSSQDADDFFSQYVLIDDESDSSLATTLTPRSPSKTAKRSPYPSPALWQTGKSSRSESGLQSPIKSPMYRKTPLLK